MLTSIFSILKALPSNFWYVLAGFLGVSSITTPIAIAFLIVNSASFEYKAGTTEINLKGKQLADINQANIDKLEEQIAYQNQTILELTSAAREKNLGKKLPQLKEVEQAVVESSIRLDDVNQSQTELNKFIDSTIAE